MKFQRKYNTPTRLLSTYLQGFKKAFSAPVPAPNEEFHRRETGFFSKYQKSERSFP
jgi:hypothetical protein